MLYREYFTCIRVNPVIMLWLCSMVREGWIVSVSEKLEMIENIGLYQFRCVWKKIS